MPHQYILRLFIGFVLSWCGLEPWLWVPKLDNGNMPQCQLCCKYGHIVLSCYHQFDVNFQRGHLPPTTYNNSGSSSHNNNHVQVMVASPLILDSLFLDTRAIHHLTNNANHLSEVHPYHETDQVSIGNGKKLPIHHIGSTFLPTQSKNFQLNKVLHVLKFATQVFLVFPSFATTITLLLNFILDTFLSRISARRTPFSKATLKMVFTNFQCSPCLIRTFHCWYTTPHTFFM